MAPRTGSAECNFAEEPAGREGDGQRPHDLAHALSDRPRRLRCRPRPGPRASARRGRRPSFTVGVPHAHLPDDARRQDGETGVDDDFARAGFENVGAWILGRNMFGPIRGAWPDEDGRAGGARRRPTTCRSSCSRIIRARRSRWRAARVPLRDRRDRRGARSREGGRRGQGRACRRRRCDDPAVPEGAGSIDELHLALSPALLGTGEPSRGSTFRLWGIAWTSTCRRTGVTHLVIRRS